MTKGYSFDALVKEVDGVKEAVRIPTPDFYLPLKHDLMIREGKGSPVQIDVSSAQDGSVMAPLPGLYQADFTRASKATYIDDQGVLREAQINEPRFEKEGVLIEGSSTNILPNTEGFGGDFYTANQTSGSTTVTIQQQGTFTYANVVKSYTGWCLVGYNKTLIAGKTYTGSVLLRHVSGANSFRVCMQSTASSGQPYQEGTSVTLKTGVWTKVSVTWTVEPGKEHAGIQVRLGVDGTSEPYEMDFMAFQIEELPFASSYIPTNGTPVTRVGESLSLPASTLPDAANSFSVMSEVSMKNFTDNSLTVFQQRQGSNNYRWLRYVSASSNAIEARSSINSMARLYKPHDYVKGVNKLAMVVGNDVTSLYVNDEVHISHEALNTTSFGSAPIFIGSLSGGTSENIWGHIKNFRIWNQAISAELIKYL